MKKKLASQLTELEVHAFTDIVRKTVLDSEGRVKNELKSYLDKKLEEQSGKFDQKLEEQSISLLKEMDKRIDQKNREQTVEICEVITSVMDTSDKLYVTHEEFKKHTSNLRAHQS